MKDKDIQGAMQGKITMPILRPVIIPTKGLKWYKRFIRHFERRRWEIVEEYSLYIPWLEKTILIPAGFIFDAASVPRIFWPLINPTGILLIGSIFHDFGYRYNCFLDENYNIINEEAGRMFFDEQIRKINIYINDIHSMNTVAWGILKAFGWAAWLNNRRRDRNVVLDFIKVAEQIVAT